LTQSNRNSRSPFDAADYVTGVKAAAPLRRPKTVAEIGHAICYGCSCLGAFVR
jgi:hypothetical protein